MRTSIRWILFTGLFCSAACLAAAPVKEKAKAESVPELPPVDLLPLLKIAYENNANIRDQEQSLKIADEQLGVGYSVLYPKATASGTMVKTNNADTGTALSLRLDQNIFDGGMEYSEIAYRRKLVEAEKARLDDAKDLVRHDVMIAVLNGALAQEQLKIYQSSWQTQKNRLAELQRRFRLGQIREPDLIQADLDTRKVERLSVDAHTSIDAARRDLMLAIKQDLPTPYVFPDLDALVNEIRRNNTLGARTGYATRVLELETEAADYNMRTKWRGSLPTLGAFAEANPRHGTGTDDNYQIGLAASWTLFEGFKTPHEVAVARAEKTQLEIRLDNLRFNQQKTLAQLRIERENAVTKLHDLRDNVVQAERALKLQQLDYGRRLVTALEIQTSLQEVLDLNLEQAALRYRAGQLRVEAITTGGSL